MEEATGIWEMTVIWNQVDNMVHITHFLSGNKGNGFNSCHRGISPYNNTGYCMYSAMTHRITNVTIYFTEQSCIVNKIVVYGCRFVSLKTE